MPILFKRLAKTLSAIGLVFGLATPLAAAPEGSTYTPDEIVAAGHHFFGQVSGNLATLVEKAVGDLGLPNGYIMGQEASGAFFGGLRFGDGYLYSKTAPPQQVYWQGPSFGFDVGGDGDRTMMLVYELPGSHDIYRRFAGVDGSAYFVGGLGMTVLTNDDPQQGAVYVVPIRSGLGVRLGANVGYLKFTPRPTWNPF